LSEKGFKAPTPIQRLTLPSALRGRLDIVGAAETGSGKTLAFGIPIVQGILGDMKREKLNIDDFKDIEDKEEISKTTGRLRALILTPTRELAVQIKDHIMEILTKTNISIAVIFGGMNADKQLRLLKRKPEIVIGTPGRLWELIQEGEPHLQGLPNIRYLAIDETDRMSEKGHFAELEKILEMISSTESKIQRFVMSATLSIVHKAPFYKKGKQMKQKSPKQKLKELMNFAGVAEQRKVVDLTSEVKTATLLEESVIHCAIEEKDSYLYYFIKAHKGRTIVFCNSINCVRRLGNLFSYLDTKPLPLHAEMHQKQRLKNLERFTKQENGLLIATDVAARGLDIPNIEHVVHYQVPRTTEGYIHRSGRTARANNAGISVLIIDPSEHYLYKKLRLALSRETDMPIFPIEKKMYDHLLKSMQCAQRLDKMLLKTKKEKLDKNWWKKAAEEADIILSDHDDEDDKREKAQDVAGLSQQILITKLELKQHLNTLFISSERKTRYPSEFGNPLKEHEMFPEEDKTAIHALNTNIKSQVKLKKDLSKKRSKKKGERKFKGFKKRCKQAEKA